MANVPENLGWVTGIRQFETTDPIEGGPDGVDNIALSQLASRTKYLYDMVNSLMAPFLGTTGTNGKGWVLFNDIVANIPAGWAEVTEMQGRAPFGLKSGDLDFGSIGNTGGAKTVTLNTVNLPDIVVNRSEADNGEEMGNLFLMSNLQPAGQSTIVGGNAPVNKMNPFRVVTYIKWVGL